MFSVKTTKRLPKLCSAILFIVVVITNIQTTLWFKLISNKKNNAVDIIVKQKEEDWSKRTDYSNTVATVVAPSTPHCKWQNAIGVQHLYCNLFREGADENNQTYAQNSVVFHGKQLLQAYLISTNTPKIM